MDSSLHVNHISTKLLKKKTPFWFGLCQTHMKTSDFTDHKIIHKPKLRKSDYDLNCRVEKHMPWKGNIQ